MKNMLFHRQIVWILIVVAVSIYVSQTVLASQPVCTKESRSSELCTIANISDLSMWDGRLICVCDGAKEIKPDTLDFRSLDVENSNGVISLFVGERNKLFLLARKTDKDEFYVQILDGKNKSTIPITGIQPEDFRGSKICADDNSLIVSTQRKYLHWNMKSAKPERLPDLKLYSYPSKIRLNDDELFVAYDQGEWGGSFFKYNLKTGLRSEITKENACVKDFTWDKQGNIWFLTDYCDVNCIYKLSGNKAELFTSANGIRPEIQKMFNKSADIHYPKSFNWKYLPTEFSAISFDESGKAVVVTKQEGIVSLTRGEWIKLNSGGSFGTQYMKSGILLPDGDICIVGCSYHQFEDCGAFPPEIVIYSSGKNEFKIIRGDWEKEEKKLFKIEERKLKRQRT